MTYICYVNLCGGCTDGHLEIEADNEDDAYEKAMSLVGDRLAEAFPELDITYSVEL